MYEGTVGRIVGYLFDVSPVHHETLLGGTQKIKGVKVVLVEEVYGGARRQGGQTS